MSETKDMSFLEHLEELRKRLFRAVLGVVIGIVVVVSFDQFIIEEVIMGPRRLDFVSYRMWCELSDFLGLGDKLCFKEMNFSLQSTTM
jgi:sec-independent protein translocase protein TatC